MFRFSSGRRSMLVIVRFKYNSRSVRKKFTYLVIVSDCPVFDVDSFDVETNYSALKRHAGSYL